MKDFDPEIAEAVFEFMDSEEWKYDFDEEMGLIKLSLSTNSKLQSYRIYLSLRSDGLSMLLTMPVKATKDVRSKMAEFITRANYGMYIGGFEMDCGDGEIRFRSSLISPDFVPTIKSLQMLFYTSVNTVDHYADALASVLFGFAEPEEAIRLADEK